MFKTDNGGIATSIADAKLCYCSSSTWATRLSQITKQRGKIYICTYSLPSYEYVKTILGKRPYDISVIAHSKFFQRASEIKSSFPAIKIALRPDIHAKIVLIEPNTVWISSENFGKSNWKEVAIGMHSDRAFNHFMKEFQYFLEDAKEV